ncbi:hypothetical protein GGTG_12345 [Gaeumannomyces tritici R3-111a-1]|uniref:Uncharacterized protein n=1 Tax=Gaeumannomyces tritici (strain R3-111a-1) TaxID=644352 RepID=J3PFS0_GAET3|nr:hypothetical protein GGTG_12345 [Gaeumannomyces tritici R3-111a-1]EJT70172.1 hypothetical protein GGTG_12345 [Gaeumannomyces tritici R3-111a-1]
MPNNNTATYYTWGKFLLGWSFSAHKGSLSWLSQCRGTVFVGSIGNETMLRNRNVILEGDRGVLLDTSGHPRDYLAWELGVLELVFAVGYGLAWRMANGLSFMIHHISGGRCSSPGG